MRWANIVSNLFKRRAPNLREVEFSSSRAVHTKRKKKIIKRFTQLYRYCIYCDKNLTSSLRLLQQTLNAFASSAPYRNVEFHRNDVLILLYYILYTHMAICIYFAYDFETYLCTTLYRCSKLMMINQTQFVMSIIL